ncbi:hypothetical protein ABZ468_13650 [Streptomyces sp. NPDC005708]|uniref:hypothetical protein n=1 Tax=unclassified Streptomyces TaxID=2593676 RepID=UPI0033D367CD
MAWRRSPRAVLPPGPTVCGAAWSGSAIDAALAVIAGRLGGNVVLYTSDEDDTTKLCAEAVRVVPL